MNKEEIKFAIEQYKSYAEDFKKIIKNYPELWSVWSSKPRSKPRMLWMTHSCPDEWNRFLEENPKFKDFFKNPTIINQYRKASIEAMKYFENLLIPGNTWKRSKTIDAEIWNDRYALKELWNRYEIIPYRCINNIVYVNNGQKHHRLFVDKSMIGHKFGEFVFTRKKVLHKKKVKDDKRKKKR